MCYLDLETIRETDTGDPARRSSTTRSRAARSPRPRPTSTRRPACTSPDAGSRASPPRDFTFAQIAKPGARRKQISGALVTTTRTVGQQRATLARIAQAASQIHALYERFGPDEPWGFADPTGWKCSERYCPHWTRVRAAQALTTGEASRPRPRTYQPSASRRADGTSRSPRAPARYLPTGARGTPTAASPATSYTDHEGAIHNAQLAPPTPAAAATGLDHHHHVLSSTSGSLGARTNLKGAHPVRDIATAQLSGNLTRDVELRALPSGADVARLRVASTSRRRQGEEWVDKTNYFSVDVFGAQARACAQYLPRARASSSTPSSTGANGPTRGPAPRGRHPQGAPGALRGRPRPERRPPTSGQRRHRRRPRRRRPPALRPPPTVPPTAAPAAPGNGTATEDDLPF